RQGRRTPGRPRRRSRASAADRPDGRRRRDAAGPAQEERSAVVMTILGEMIIGQQCVRGTGGEAFGFNPATRADLAPGFGLATGGDVERACALAAQAFDPYRALPLEQRARFLEAIAEQILAIGPELIERAMQETGLPQARLEGERMRTVSQLRLFA